MHAQYSKTAPEKTSPALHGAETAETFQTELNYNEGTNLLQSLTLDGGKSCMPGAESDQRFTEYYNIPLVRYMEPKSITDIALRSETPPQKCGS